MALGLAARLGAAELELDPANRFLDLAFECEIYEEKPNGEVEPTGEVSPVYGGRWDKHRLEYVKPDPDDLLVLTLPCSRIQFQLLTSEYERIEAGGGRGGGKSEGGCLRALRFMIEHPLNFGRVIAPTYPHVWIARTKLIQTIPHGWIMPNTSLTRPRPEFTLWNGHNVEFRSTKDPDSLRGWDGIWIWSDEDQQSSTYSGEVAWLCLRDSDDPRMWRTMTPAGGEALQRHDAHESDASVETYTFSGYANPFMSHRAMDVARASMHPDTFKVEVEADWDTVRKLEEQGRLTKVFSWFSPETHGLDLEDLISPQWARHDITNKVAQRSTGRKGGAAVRYIAGVDPNYHAPNACTIYKVFAGLRPGDPERWVVVDYLERNGHCGQLAESLKKVRGTGGYTTKNTVIIMDASGRYNRLNSEKASYKLMRNAGFNVMLMKSDRGNMNPHVKQSIDDVIFKMDPVHDTAYGWFIVVRESTRTLIENIMDVEWNFDGTKFNRTPRPDPVDSMRYPVSYFAPVDKREPMWGETAAG